MMNTLKQALLNSCFNGCKPYRKGDMATFVTITLQDNKFFKPKKENQIENQSFKSPRENQSFTIKSWFCNKTK